MMIQKIIPQRTLFFAGEVVLFELAGDPAPGAGRAVVRTNLGRAAVRREELIEQGEMNRTPRGSDWHDLVMEAAAPGVWRLTVPLPEVGVFEAKCCFIPDDGSPLLWPAGENFRIKVASAANAAGNGIYCAFVRQFGASLCLSHAPELPVAGDESKDGVLIPPCGTFRKLIGQLDHIFGELGCRILQLLPVHPVPVTYGRMGRYGSPFAATDYFAVDPALAEFDTSATPMDQFIELIDAVHRRRGRIFMDIPVNHTGWASKLQNEHPDYFVRNADGSFQSPGAWGVVWADLCRLDYSRSEVRDVMAKVFLFWCRRGIDGFRCDAGYMVPVAAWEYIVSRVRSEYPDTVFLLEGLGGPLATQEKLLAETGLDWGYSELFQNYTRDEISRYYPYMNDAGNRFGTLANFAETHDNLRLAAKGHVYAKLRFLVTALLSQHGAFGFANGAEFFAKEKIDVHGCGALNYGNPDNLNGLIGKLNLLLGTHPAFGVGVDVKLIQCGGGNVIAALRHGDVIPEVLVLLNLDCDHASTVEFPALAHDEGTELLSGCRIAFQPCGRTRRVELAPGEGKCIGFDGYRIPEHPASGGIPEALRQQRAAAMAQRVALRLHGSAAAAKADGALLLADPERFMEKLSGMAVAPLTIWNYPEDCRREVMLPPGDALLIRSKCSFQGDLRIGRKNLVHFKSLPADDGSEMALAALPANLSAENCEVTLRITAFTSEGTLHEQSKIVMLPEGEKRLVHLAGKWSEADRHCVFGSNCYGGYSLFSAQWGRLNSKYEAILAANVSRDYPVDRRVMFTRLRAWLVIDEYSQEITSRTLEKYTAHPGNRARWCFVLPDGRGKQTRLEIEFRMALDRDAVELRFVRGEDHGDNAVPGKLILRPDLEDRVNHEVTRACDGPEHRFRSSVTDYENGFDFSPAERKLSLRVSRGSYFRAPEWNYMVDLPWERYYGLADKTDLFSPGYFSIPLAAGEETVLTAEVNGDGEGHYPAMELPAAVAPMTLAIDSLSRFTVKRDGLKTVIAGYPWFLDWGRDTLIALRGLVRFPEFQEQSSEILRRFAAFERSGTIPNMICGGNDSNRDTSDAPLYLIVAVRDYIDATGDRDFLHCDCGGRKMKDILLSIVGHYRDGTPNGIVADRESGLIFSPSHFTWMDTNFPAGTPREGYPIEIQALWYAALRFLGLDVEADQVSASIEKFFFGEGRLSDCLHCHRGTPAARAAADDHIRCNMLLALTLGAVRDPGIRKRILRGAERLLIPGAIRTLADAPVDYQLPVVHNGRLLNDPARPYKGNYCGPEDTERKVAYHNGTAWCWPFPAYCEALWLMGGEKSRRRALALLNSCVAWFENGVIGEMPEVLDGDAPHFNGGCLAQAWSASEYFRVLKLLEKSGNAQR